ncbi:hypothetical protein H5410_061061 [Solanum commersonii]|uniref:Uncharacterized protein n=1 Tax=Solanum commersonii TaxID=4109 RepID=A0A9J5W7I0_SOLCO|nr:hypothetical protein H5410_061061 [Solanum commersonii]
MNELQIMSFRHTILGPSIPFAVYPYQKQKKKKRNQCQNKTSCLTIQTYAGKDGLFQVGIKVCENGNCKSCNIQIQQNKPSEIPIFADECTTEQTRKSYTRMLIEVDVTKPIPTEITVMYAHGQSFQQVIVFD